MLSKESLTVASYIEDYPGLVHFIYVNRRTHQLMAPALNITNADEAGATDATQLLKEKVGNCCFCEAVIQRYFQSNCIKYGNTNEVNCCSR